MAEYILVGKVTHYFTRLGVAGVEMMDSLSLGDQIHILGNTTDFQQPVTSMELDHQPIETAYAGQLIGLKVWRRARPGDMVYKLSGEPEPG